MSPHTPVGSDWWLDSHTLQRIGDKFDIHVGPVVPHRDPEEGQWFRYIDARALSRQETFDVTEARSRRFSRRTFSPPFVVIRRTSRPDEKRRAIGTLVVGEKAVAVENHLLVAIPKSGGIEACKALLTLLKAESTDEWLNGRIRCRHLTTRALSEVPWL